MQQDSAQRAQAITTPITHPSWRQSQPWPQPFLVLCSTVGWCWSLDTATRWIRQLLPRPLSVACCFSLALLAGPQLPSPGGAPLASEACGPVSPVRCGGLAQRMHQPGRAGAAVRSRHTPAAGRRPEWALREDQPFGPCCPLVFHAHFGVHYLLSSLYFTHSFIIHSFFHHALVMLSAVCKAHLSQGVAGVGLCPSRWAPHGVPLWVLMGLSEADLWGQGRLPLGGTTCTVPRRGAGPGWLETAPHLHPALSRLCSLLPRSEVRTAWQGLR